MISDLTKAEKTLLIAAVSIKSHKLERRKKHEAVFDSLVVKQFIDADGRLTIDGMRVAKWCQEEQNRLIQENNERVAKTPVPVPVVQQNLRGGKNSRESTGPVRFGSRTRR